MKKLFPILLTLVFLQSCSGIPSSEAIDDKKSKIVSQFAPSTQIADYVRNILEDRNGSLWFGTNGYGVARYNPYLPMQVGQESMVAYFSPKNGLSGWQVTGIIKDQKGNLWFSTSRGVSKYDGKTFTTFTRKDGLLDDSTWNIFEDSRGTIWVSTIVGLCKFDTHTNEKGKQSIKITPFPLPVADVENPQISLSAKVVRSILEDQQGKLWFGTDGHGICIYDPFAEQEDRQAFTHITKKDGLCDNNIACLMEDGKGNIWIGTMFGGLSRYDPSAKENEGNAFTNFSEANENIFTRFIEINTIGNNEVIVIYEDTAGNIWFSSEGFGVYRYNANVSQENALTNFNEDDGLGVKAVQTIYEDTQGRFWVGGGGGLYRLDGERFVNVTVDGPWE